MPAIPVQIWLQYAGLALGVMAVATLLCVVLAWMVMRRYQSDVEGLRARLAETEERSRLAAAEVDRVARAIDERLAALFAQSAPTTEADAARDAAAACEEMRERLETLSQRIQATLGRARQAEAAAPTAVAATEHSPGTNGASTPKLAVAEAAGQPSVEYRFQQGWDVVVWKGEWSDSVGERVRRATRGILDDLRGPLRRRVVLDLAALNELPASAAAAIGEVARHAQGHDQTLRLATGSAERCAMLAQYWPVEAAAPLPAMFRSVDEATAGDDG